MSERQTSLSRFLLEAVKLLEKHPTCGVTIHQHQGVIKKLTLEVSVHPDDIVPTTLYPAFVLTEVVKDS